jgi:hypothetical protein
MLKNYRFWFWLAVVFQFITAAIHSISLFVTPEPGNETERQLFELLTTYRFEMGSGFTPTMANITTALSSCFTLLYAFAGLINAFLLRRRANDLTRGVLAINVLVFGASFVIMAAFTFPPPIILTGLVFVCLAFALYFRHLELA